MITCSRCGASNPQANKFCGTCGQLLQPAATPAADLPPWLSEVGVPDEAPAAAGAAQTPDWLAQLQQDTRPAPASADTLPDWLRADVEAEASSASAPASRNDVPDWLREIEAESAAATPAQPAPGQPADELPPWLRDDSAPAPQAQPTSATTGNELPDWLREVEAEVAPPTAALPANASAPVADELPPWLRDDSTPAPQAQPTSAAVGNELPDWLREVEAEVTPPAASAPAHSTPGQPADELPPWLRDDSAPATPLTSAAPSAAVGNELPDWLREVEADVTLPAASAPAQLATSQPADELPPWLRDDSAPAPQAPSMNAAAGNKLPDWLREVEVETPASSMNSATTQPLDLPLPDWSSEFGAVPAAEMTQQETQELPTWLQEPPSATTGQTQPFAALPVQAAARPVDDDLPAWLVDDTAPPERPTPSAAATEALPSWLLDQPTTASQEPPSNTASAAQDDLPSWLHSVDEPAPAASGAGLPDWLALPDAPAADAGAARGHETPANDGLPAWLSDDAPAADAGTARVYQTPTNDGLPPWLSDDAPAADAGVPRGHETPANDGLPAWLSDDTPVADAGAARVYQAPDAAAPGSAETIQLPAWLSEAEQSTSATPASSAPQSADADLPPWLSGIAEEPSPPTTNTASALPSWLDEPDQPAPQQTAAPQSEFLGGLELPAWLRSEQEAPPATAAVAEPAPSWLQRGATEGDEPAPTPVALEVAPAPRIVRSPERVAAMQMLEQMVVSPAPEPMPQPVVRRRSWLLPVLLTLAVLLIVGAILFVLLNQRLGLNFGAAPLPAPAASTAVQMIAAVPANKPVLLAYDWDAQRVAELGALEDAVLGQLVQRTDVPLVLLSTDPQGALLAGQRTTQLLAIKDGFHDQYSLGLVNLGFKAGGPIALQRFAARAAFGDLFAQDAGGYDLRNEPVAMQSICGGPTVASCEWDDVGMLVIMADEVEDVRGWFEQVRSAYPALPTLLLTPAEIGPQVQPYAVTPNTSALSGLASAEAYNQARGIQDERLGRQVDAAAVGGATFALLVLFGAVPAYITGRRQRMGGEDGAWTR